MIDKCNLRQKPTPTAAPNCRGPTGWKADNQEEVGILQRALISSTAKDAKPQGPVQDGLKGVEGWLESFVSVYS